MNEGKRTGVAVSRQRGTETTSAASAPSGQRVFTRGCQRSRSRSGVSDHVGQCTVSADWTEH